MKNRIDYFDVIKTICIFLIVFVHYPWINESLGSNVSMMVTIIGVPLFFMINGALLLNKELNINKHLLKIKKYIINVVILKFLILLICIITSRVSLNDYEIKDVIFYLITNNNLKNVPAEHLWFMYVLLKIYLIYPFIYFAFKREKAYLKYIFIFCLIFSIGIESLNDLSLILNKFLKTSIINFNAIFDSYSPTCGILQYLTYFILGYYLHNNFVNKNISKKRIMVLILGYCVGLSLIFLLKYIQTGYLFYGPCRRIPNDYSKFGNLMMCFSIFILISKIKLKNYKIFNYIGARTLNIYYVHMIVLAYINIYMSSYFTGYFGMKINTIRTIVTIIISIIITEILKKIPIIKNIFS